MASVRSTGAVNNRAGRAISSFRQVSRSVLTSDLSRAEWPNSGQSGISLITAKISLIGRPGSTTVAKNAVPSEGGTKGSNPAPSAGESVFTGAQPHSRLRTLHLGGGLRVG